MKRKFAKGDRVDLKYPLGEVMRREGRLYYVRVIGKPIPRQEDFVEVACYANELKFIRRGPAKGGKGK